MIFRFIQVIGIVFIISICTLGTIYSIDERDINIIEIKQPLAAIAALLEDRFFDMRMKLTLGDSKKFEKRIILAAIDDESLSKIGRWPWNRNIVANVVDKLNSFGAKIISFDIFFSEPEKVCNAKSPDEDLAKSFERFQSKPGNKIILPYSVFAKAAIDNSVIDTEKYFKEAPEILLNFMMTTKSDDGSQFIPSIVERKVFPLDILIKQNTALSHIESYADNDGVFRHYPLVDNIDEINYPSLALQTYQYYTDDKTTLRVNANNKYLETAHGHLDLNDMGETKVRWMGDRSSFPVVNMFTILNTPDNDPKMKKIFEGNIVYIGSTAYGAHDLRNTPIDAMLPGVYYHMNATHMLLDGFYFKANETSVKYTWLILAISSFIILSIMFLGNAILDFLAVNLIVISLYYIDTYYLIPKGYNLKIFFCILSVILCYSWSTFLHFYESNKEKKKIKGTFSRYLAPSIVNDLLKNPEKLKLGGEKKNITVFFSDVRDFTSISEKLTPEQLTTCLNIYMTMMTDTLFEHKGTLDKYIGDAMVAYWGAPVELENHAYWAVKGALQMIERLPAINEVFKKEGYPLFKHGIGLNTGECSVGNMGSNQIFSYTALGDSMNLGARLESLCKFYGVQLNISEYTKNAIPDHLKNEFKFRTLDKVRVKGKENSVTIYEVLHSTHDLYSDDEALKNYELAFESYLKQDFSNSIESLKSLSNKYPEDKTFTRMLHICEDFKETPPATDWDGTYTHKSK
jgi:adenylate cyclase